MNRIHWTREQLSSLVQGRAFCLRDPTGGFLAAPAWLTEAAAEEWTLSPAESINVVHPDDRALLVDTFISAIDKPGIPHSLRIRERTGEEWSHVELVLLSQFGNETLDAMVMTRLLVLGSQGEAAPVHVPGESGESEVTSWVLVELDHAGVISAVHGQVERTLGYDPAVLAGRSLGSLVHPDGLADSLSDWAQLLADPTSTRVTRRRWRHSDGSEVWLESSYLHLGEDRIVGVLIDISDRVARERELHQLTDQLKLFADEVPTALARCDAAGDVHFHNALWARLVDGEGRQTRLHEIAAPSEAHRIDDALGFVATADPMGRRELEVAGVDGGSTWRVTLRAVGQDTTDRVIIASIADVTDTVRLRREARHDPLTGLLNRGALEDLLAVALAEDAEGTVLLFLDLDGFKTVNDVQGHDAGDAVLREVARRIADGIRAGDDVGRYGGDEFVVVCRAVEPGREVDLITRIEQRLAGPVTVAEGRWHPAASIGSARARLDDDLASLLRRADLDMLRIKRARHAGTPTLRSLGAEG